MPRLPLRPLGAVATAAALLTYVGCSSSTTKDDAGTSLTPPAASGKAGAAARPEPEAEGKSSKLFAQWPTPRAVLVVSGEMDGYLEPCGCTGGQLGGLIRRYDFVERLGAQGWPYALIDLGGLVREPAGARGGFEQAKLKYGIALKALSTFKYNAVALGADDLKVGVGEAMAQFLNNLAEPTRIVAANVEPGAGFETIIKPSVIVEAGKLKIGVTAVIDPESLAKLNDPDKDELLPSVKRPDDVLPAVFADLEGKTDYQVLMVQAPPAEAKRLAGAYPGFDVVVSTSTLDDPEKDPQTLNGGKTLLVNVGRRGKYVGAVGFFGEGDEPRYQRVSLNDKYNGPATAVKKVIEDEYRGLLKSAGVVENFPRHDFVSGAPGAKFVGAESCKTCHPNTYTKWAGTKHAQAFESLLHDPKPNTVFDAECVSCHTTGFEYTSGWVSAEATPYLKGNQCENCHGPASKHVAEPDDQAFRQALALTVEQLTQNRTCYRCHDDDNSPKFDFPTYWGKVVHKGLDTYTDPKVHQGAAPKAETP